MVIISNDSYRCTNNVHFSNQNIENKVWGFSFQKWPIFKHEMKIRISKKYFSSYENSQVFIYVSYLLPLYYILEYIIVIHCNSNYRNCIYQFILFIFHYRHFAKFRYNPYNVIQQLLIIY